jgi:pseudaminic acid cytidylyltransferase
MHGCAVIFRRAIWSGRLIWNDVAPIDDSRPMKAVAVIPARGGSKRLPRKNVLDFLGRPIIAYTIEAARASGCFDRVVVSTEDEEIVAISERFGAHVHRRSIDLATDSARVVQVCLNFLDNEAEAGRDWDIMGCLYATAPLRNAEDVRATVALLEPARCAFAMAVTKYNMSPHEAMKVGPDNKLTPMWPELLEHRASDLPPLRVDNGSTYAVDIASFQEQRTFCGRSLRGYEMPMNRSIDIDTREDFELALWQAQRSGIANAKLAID